ncbi:SprT family zinc-dependent metalloprotease [Endozoicomonas sp. SCSIO W0465]|uniref:SprT family zinc-dependent metalloprotease n=1 Tax=Endozoicomonas sp. SCSIO W0465 TaxID=2918516 RepID=UPI0020762339|nr:SprT family zinc-dependent metalloprotease [Endozoicomonas sp. SCSIO W0465]USE34938.1 SprT family zinc-dependent metalloprotease [Endozoicomonas sp. SCSIO W0465]
MQNDLHQIEQRILELYQEAESFFQKPFRKPYIRLDLTGETAGQAWIEKHQLRFNKVLLQENREHFIRQTVAHEVAHLLAYELFGPKIRAHGKEWHGIMARVFRLPADRCHRYDTGRSSRKQWLYQCHCHGKTIHLSTVRHNRSQRGTVYLCTACKGPLKFLGQPPSTSNKSSPYFSSLN